MYALTIVTLLAASVVANPQAANGASLNTLTVAQAQRSCGNNQSVYCCNKVSNKQTGNAIGNGPELLNGLSLFDQCSKIDVNVIAVANNLLNKECQANAACCQDSGSNASGGLVNAALPCVAISNLV
ncbi:hydrophobin 1 [Fusarium avenaceum]|nr:hydrophobin 1 [Fusarium avenaceum]